MELVFGHINPPAEIEYLDLRILLSRQLESLPPVLEGKAHIAEVKAVFVMFCPINHIDPCTVKMQGGKEQPAFVLLHRRGVFGLWRAEHISKRVHSNRT